MTPSSKSKANAVCGIAQKLLAEEEGGGGLRCVCVWVDVRNNEMLRRDTDIKWRALHIHSVQLIHIKIDKYC